MASTDRITVAAKAFVARSLEKLGYLDRRPDPDDLRSKRIALTARGTSAVGVTRDAVAEVEAAWTEQLGTNRFAELRQPLLDIRELT